MIANKSIGECVLSIEVNGKGRDYLIRPSLFAINRLGSPQEIKYKTDACIKALDLLSNGIISSAYKYECIDVIQCCCSEYIPHYVTGYFRTVNRYVGSEEVDSRLEFVEGKLTPAQIIILANHCVRWGVIGDPKVKRKSSGEDWLFDPSEYVGTGIAVLGLGSTEAWNMTMTEFQRAIDAKYPPDPSKEPIPQERLEQLEAMAKKAHAKLDPNRGMAKKPVRR